MLHVLIWIGWCLVPALILLPLRFLDREPANEIAQEQKDEPRKPAEMSLDAPVATPMLTAV